MVKPADIPEYLVHSMSKKTHQSCPVCGGARTLCVEGVHQVRDGERVGPRSVGVVLIHRVGLAGGHTIGINEIKCMSVFFFLQEIKALLFLHQKKTQKN